MRKLRLRSENHYLLGSSTTSLRFDKTIAMNFSKRKQYNHSVRKVNTSLQEKRLFAGFIEEKESFGIIRHKIIHLDVIKIQDVVQRTTINIIAMFQSTNI